jgi:hypothetical protein
METCFEYCESGKGWFSSDEKKWIKKIHELKEQYPDLVEIRNEPETNNGCICCTLPAEWMKIRPPRKLNMTEEERAAIGERLKASRKTM